METETQESIILAHGHIEVGRTGAGSSLKKMNSTSYLTQALL